MPEVFSDNKLALAGVSIRHFRAGARSEVGFLQLCTIPFAGASRGHRVFEIVRFWLAIIKLNSCRSSNKALVFSTQLGWRNTCVKKTWELFRDDKTQGNKTMKRREMLSMMAAAVLGYSSGCVVSDGPDRRTYYYYPDEEVYYHPRDGRYYWYDRDRREWRNDRNPPPRFTPRDRDRVRIDSDREPYKDHDRNKKDYPPGRYDRDDRGQPRKDDRDKDDRREPPGPDRR